MLCFSSLCLYYLFPLSIPGADDFCGFNGVFFYEALDGVEDDSESAVVFSFHFLDLFSQRFVAHNHLADLCESAHNLDVHPNGLFAFEYRRKHSYALFRENVGQFSSTAPT